MTRPSGLSSVTSATTETARFYAVAVIVVSSVASPQSGAQAAAQPELGSRVVQTLTSEGLKFRDLDRDGHLSPFEDWRRSAQERATDLLSRMTLEEKAATMMHPVLMQDEQITQKHVTSFLSRNSGSARELAERNNRAQELAERERLAIPLTLSTDPRNGLGSSYGSSVAAADFSKWPDALGFGAIGNPDEVRRFAAIASQEYRAVGFNMALSPQADLATEPRWARVSGTFGEEPEKVGPLVSAYIEGFQGGRDGVTASGVATIVKHFAGYGAAKDGFDSHNYYGRFATFPAKAFNQHLVPFKSAFEVHASGVMPTYSILEVPGFPYVGGAYNKPLLQDVLRKREGFGGLVLSDWGVTEDCVDVCIEGRKPGEIPKHLTRGKPWGVESVPRAERVVEAIEAGVDQIGDADDSEPVVAAVKSGRLAASQVDEAVRRILIIKFRLGLFENPYADPDRAMQIVGQSSFQAAALEAQERSLVLLENRKRLLPVQSRGRRVFLRGVQPEAARAVGFTVVDSLDRADLAIVRTVTPWQRLHPGYIMGAIQHEGDLDFKPDNPDLLAIQEAAHHVPTIVTVYLDRPAILTNIRESASALIGNFGVSDDALMNVIIGRAKPEGRLPVELPSSMEAVRRQKSDLPHDSRAPLYKIGFGRRYQ